MQFVQEIYFRIIESFLLAFILKRFNEHSPVCYAFHQSQLIASLSLLKHKTLWFLEKSPLKCILAIANYLHIIVMCTQMQRILEVVAKVGWVIFASKNRPGTNSRICVCVCVCLSAFVFVAFICMIKLELSFVKYYYLLQQTIEISTTDKSYYLSVMHRTCANIITVIYIKLQHFSSTRIFILMHMSILEI